MREQTEVSVMPRAAGICAAFQVGHPQVLERSRYAHGCEFPAASTARISARAPALGNEIESESREYLVDTPLRLQVSSHDGQGHHRPSRQEALRRGDTAVLSI